MLDDALRDAPSDKRTSVHIEFALPYRRGAASTGKLSAGEALEQRRAAFEQGVTALREAGVLSHEGPAFDGRAALEVTAEAGGLSRLRRDPRVATIAASVAADRHRLRAQHSLQNQFSFPVHGGVNVFGLCGYWDDGPQHCGQGVTVGVLELSAIPDDQLSYFSGSWFSNRGGTPAADPQYDPHGAWVGGIIRNSYGTDIIEYEMGGSRSLSQLLYGYMNTSDDEENSSSEGPLYRRRMMGPYDWMTEQGARIVNHSWGMERYYHPDTAAEGAAYDRHLDNAVARWPYVLNVMAAGNAGQAGNNDNNRCVNTSAESNPTPWTATDCTRVGWWGHNGLIVGGAFVQQPELDSSWMNGPTGDEAPHVSAAYAPIELPWMRPYQPGGFCGNGEEGSVLCGTSFAAPTITSLAANLVSEFTGLASFPEALRAILMASATRYPLTGQPWSSDDAVDGRSGVGLPNGYYAREIARNVPGALHGYRTSYVPPDATYEQMPNGTLTFDTSVATRLHVYLTWVSDFSHVQPGVVYPADDFDLRVWGPNNSYASSVSWKKTTEHAVIDLPAGSSSYSYDVRLYSRSSNPNANVFLAMAWTVEDHP